MASGFNIRSVEIEGFKGFTSPQTIDFEGRHVFLLGRVGKGKSSIVEAVRWGLFGSTSRRNEVVRNTRYAGDCRVIITLVRDGEPWNLVRTYNPGTDRTSIPVLTDRHGTRHPLSQVMPNLDSLDAGAGAHIIFASQSAPLSRQPTDLEPFEKHIFSYLGLTHPRALLSHLDNFLRDQSEAEDKLGAEITDARKDIDDQIEQEETRRRNILNAPPWGDGPPPSMGTSEQRVRRFTEEITGNPPSADLDGASLSALIEDAEKTLREQSSVSQNELNVRAKALAITRKKLEDSRAAQSKTKEQETKVQNTKGALATIYAGLTPDELRQQFADARSAWTTATVKRRIASDAAFLIARRDSDEVPCPVCESPHDRHELKDRVENAVNQFGDSKDSGKSMMDALESRIEKASNLETLLEMQTSELESVRDEGVLAESFVSGGDRTKLEQGQDISQLIAGYSQQETAINAQLEDQEAWFKEKRADLAKFKEEERFQRIQGLLLDLTMGKREIDRVIDSYNSLVKFGESVRTIREAVNSRLDERLTDGLPRVSDIFSKSFYALTNHDWYDRVVVSSDPFPTLQLGVASSQDPTGAIDPTGVLNGQAESALTIVPYFAFSQADDTPTEVLLVMLDDPTRASDTEHIYMLLQRLEELERNVQLVVASQEAERFTEMVPKVFDAGSYIIVAPTGWSPYDGPELEISHG